MALSSDLQDMVADVSAAIAGNVRLGRADLEIWRRRLTAATEAARGVETAAVVRDHAIAQLADGIERGVRDLTGLARHARQQVAS